MATELATGAALSLALTIALASAPAASAAQAPSAIATLEPHVRTRVACGIQAATRFSLPANLVIAVAEQEGGRAGQWVKNKNGTYDVGPMQLNTSYLKTLERFGISPSDVAAEGCYPFELAAWRLRRHLDRDTGDIWTRASNYHSRTPTHNARYRTALRARAAKWARWLSEHVPTVAIAALESTQTLDPLPLPSPHVHPSQTIAARALRRQQKLSQTKPSSQTALHVKAGSECASSIDEIAALDDKRRKQLLELVSRGPAASSSTHEDVR